MRVITAAMNIEATKADVSKTPEAKQAEITEQLAVLQESGVDELCAMADELVNNRGETDGMLQEAGFNGRELRRQSAIAGTIAMINAITEENEQQEIDAGLQRAIDTGEFPTE